MISLVRHRRWIKKLGLFSAILLLIQSIGCSSSSDNNNEEQTLPNEEVVINDGGDFLPPSFDPTLSVPQQDDSLSLPELGFEFEDQNQVPPELSENNTACLRSPFMNPNSNFDFSQSTVDEDTCFDDRRFDDRDALLEALFISNISSFRHMRGCFNSAIQERPRRDASQQELDYAYLNAQFKLVTCFQALKREQALAPIWAAQQRQAMHQHDPSMILLLMGLLGGGDSFF